MVMATSRPQTGGASRGVARASDKPVKASLTNLDDQSQRVEFLFNPTEYSLSKSSSWKTVEIIGLDVPRREFTSGGPRTLTLNLFFDTYDDTNERKQSVRDYTDKIFAMTKVTNVKGEKPRPPKVMFSWGTVFSFPAVITNISVQYTLFLSDGTPVRAKMNLTLEESEDSNKKPKQNPTSQGTLGHKVYVVKPGDTIDWIAYSEYNDPTAWRFIAETNALDNPRDLKPGQVLNIRPLGS